MTVVDEQGRPEPPVDGDELATILGFLDFQRATLAWKCSGLDAKGLNTTVGASTMTLGGLLKHMACVEDFWFSEAMNGQKVSPWDTADWAADRDWEWHSAADDTPEQLRALWEDSVKRSRAVLTEVLANGGLAHRSTRTWSDGRTPTVRWILVHMIEEYSRHNGHADLIRESVDGATGE